MNGKSYNIVRSIIKDDHPPSLDQIVRLLLHGLEKSESSTVKTKIREEVEILLNHCIIGCNSQMIHLNVCIIAGEAMASR